MINDKRNFRNPVIINRKSTKAPSKLVKELIVHENFSVATPAEKQFVDWVKAKLGYPGAELSPSDLFKLQHLHRILCY